MAVGLARRDSVRSPSAYSELGLNRARAKLILCYRVRLDSLRVGRWVDDKKGNSRVCQYGDVCKLADGALVMSAEAINSSYAVPMTNGVNQTNPRADSRDVSVHPIIKRPPNQGGLFIGWRFG